MAPSLLLYINIYIYNYVQLVQLYIMCTHVHPTHEIATPQKAAHRVRDCKSLLSDVYPHFQSKQFVCIVM